MTQRLDGVDVDVGGEGTGDGKGAGKFITAGGDVVARVACAIYTSAMKSQKVNHQQIDALAGKDFQRKKKCVGEARFEPKGL